MVAHSNHLLFCRFDPYCSYSSWIERPELRKHPVSIDTGGQRQPLECWDIRKNVISLSAFLGVA